MNVLLLEKSLSGKRVLLVIDEAQNLEDTVLEQVRMLSNFETSRERLIQIVLCGQPQLALKIASPELVQLRQRISIFARLVPFSASETESYIDHRLRIAGYASDLSLFATEATALIAQHSQGIPRNINNLCSSALALGCASKRKEIDGDLVREVIADFDLDRWQPQSAAVASEISGSQQVPAFLLSAATPSRQRWGSGRVLSLTLLLLIAGMLLASRRGSVLEAWTGMKHAVAPGKTVIAPSFDASHPPLRPAVPARDGFPAPLAFAVVSTQILPSAANEKLQSLTSANTIRVAPRRTLLGICIETFGTCNSEVLRNIRRLNPQLQNPDHIEAGEILRPKGEHRTRYQAAESQRFSR